MTPEWHEAWEKRKEEMRAAVEATFKGLKIDHHKQERKDNWEKLSYNDRRDEGTDGGYQTEIN